MPRTDALSWEGSEGTGGKDRGQKIDNFSTPCGKIVVFGSDGKRVRFQVAPNLLGTDYTIFAGTEKEKAVNTEDNYVLTVAAADLAPGTAYRIVLSGGGLKAGCGDEGTECVCGSKNGFSIALGDYDPNEEEKMRQMAQAAEEGDGREGQLLPLPLAYDESRFTGYSVEMLEEENGFQFNLLDNAWEEIVFRVAWIENEEGAETEYERAAEFWIT